MGFDGVLRSQQALGYTDTLGNLGAADRAAQQARNSPYVSHQTLVEGVVKDPKYKDEQGKKQQGKKEKDGIFEEELQDLIKKEFQIEFEIGVVYRFIYNYESEKIELINTATQEIKLTLTPEQFLELTDKIRENAGIITDRTA